MSEETRKNQILALLKQHKKLENTELCKTLFCSYPTLRRDIIALENEGTVKRYRGGIVLENAQNEIISTDFRKVSKPREKKYIAEIASTFIGVGMCIFMDSSSTVGALKEYIINIPNLVILTNGLHIAYELIQVCESTTKIFMMNGEVIKDAESVVGEWSDSFLDNFKIDLAFFSPTGMDIDGAYEANYAQAVFKKRMMSLADQNILLLDDTKFGKKFAYRIAKLEAYENILTNLEPAIEYLERAEEIDIEILY
ncbi:transcriptional regulator, DeoR family [Pilibacter termitis]|uniref:Lactose phosphotransferase system repressor n=1 Tax=Pilibacter termitis TaxID=263852 RepID=A0A1T4LLH5_9ENTE|nr:DeoR/GlpR family DNA-binding transcription regulator [Pilibacter termitis]SJZ55437.1 transcriptional regulator, DeoR family [Pilibacter termitis]